MNKNLKSFFNDLELNKTSSSTSLDVKHLNIKTKVKYYSATVAALLLGASIYLSADIYVKQDTTKKQLISTYGYSHIEALIEPSFDSKRQKYMEDISALDKEIGELENKLRSTNSLQNGTYPVESFIADIKENKIKVDWEKIKNDNGYIAYEPFAINAYFANNPATKIALGDKELSFNEIMEVAKKRAGVNDEAWIEAKKMAIAKITEIAKVNSVPVDEQLFDNTLFIWKSLTEQEFNVLKEFKYVSSEKEKIEVYKEKILTQQTLYFVAPTRGYKFKIENIFNDEFQAAKKDYSLNFEKEVAKLELEESKIKEILKEKMELLKVKQTINQYYSVDLSNYENSKIFIKKLENIEESKQSVNEKMELISAALKEYRESFKSLKRGK